MPSIRKYFILILLPGLLLLSACAASQPAPTPTLVPTIAFTATAPPTATPAPTATPTPTAGQPGYPYPDPAGTDLAQADYPYPAQAGGPVRENRSRVQLTLVELAPDPENDGVTRLRALVDAVEEIEGIANLVGGLLDTEADFYARADEVPALQPGDQFFAEVSMRGDEHGARVYIVLFDR